MTVTRWATSTTPCTCPISRARGLPGGVVPFGPSGLTEHGFIVARVEIDYRKPALPGERLLIRLRVDEPRPFELHHCLRDPEQRTRELVADAKSVQVAFTTRWASPCRCRTIFAPSSRPATDAVLIYGKDSCPYTADAREHFGSRGDVQYLNVKKDAEACARCWSLPEASGACPSSSRTARSPLGLAEPEGCKPHQVGRVDRLRELP